MDPAIGSILAAVIAVSGTWYGIRVARQSKRDQARLQVAAQRSEDRSDQFDSLSKTVRIHEGTIEIMQNRLDACLTRESHVASDNVRLAGQVYKMSLALQKAGIEVEGLG